MSGSLATAQYELVIDKENCWGRKKNESTLPVLKRH